MGGTGKIWTMTEIKAEMVEADRTETEEMGMIIETETGM